MSVTQVTDAGPGKRNCRMAGGIITEHGPRRTPAMPDSQQVERWIERIPLIRNFSQAHLQIACGTVHFPVLEAGAVAYELESERTNYLMCIDGRTRVFRLSEGGREMLIYRVTGGGTCVLTTRCLLFGGNFPAESIAEERTELAARPVGTFQQLMAESREFRGFVLDD